MKKSGLFLLFLWMGISTGLRAQFSGGLGTAGNPYQVATAADLNNVRNYLGSYFIQTADINLNVSPYNTGSGWAPIASFGGSYNGNGYKVSNLYINRGGESSVALFGSTTSSASLQKIGLVNAAIVGGNNTGSLVGTNNGNITTSFSTGTVTGFQLAGGLVGSHINNIISNSYTTVNVTTTGGLYAGGLAGYSIYIITNCYASGIISGPGNNGGLVGYSEGVANNSYWNTTISGIGSSEGGTGLTSTQMRQQPSFSNWNFDTVWEIEPSSSFPILQENPQSPAPGTAEPAQYSANPTTLDFGVLLVNSNSEQTFTITNTNTVGNRDLDITEISINDGAYSISPLTALIPPENSQVFTVSFSPESNGSYPASVTLIHNASGSPSNVSLSGIGISGPSISSFTPQNTGIGTPITISGMGFSSTVSENTVWFGGVKGTVTAATPTSLTVTVPVGASYGPIEVASNGKSGISKNSFGISFPVSAAVNASTFPSSPEPMVKIENGAFLKGSGTMTDLDGDGKPDLINVYTGAVSVYRNIYTDGALTSASFAARQDFGSGDYPISVQVADLDNDGKPDLVVHNTVFFTVSVFRNTSTPGAISFDITSFSFATGITNAASYEAALGDADGDGLVDVMVAGGMGAPQHGLLTFRNTSTPGTISFASAVITNLSSLSVSSITSADFDGDGKADAAITQRGSASHTQIVAVLRSTSTIGSISFSSPAEYVTSSNYPYKIAAGDLNQDGLPEIAVAVSSGSKLNIFPNTSSPGTISFGTRQDYTSGEANSHSDLKITDVDGDGKPEVLSTTSRRNVLYVFPNTSSGGIVSLAGNLQYTFQEGGSVYDIYGMATGDANLDGKPDVMAMTYSNVGFFENRIGTAQFSPSSADLGYAASGSPKQLVLTVSNPGTLPLTISSAVSNNGNFFISPASGTVAVGGSQPFTITAQSSIPGVNNANFTFTHDAPNPVSVVSSTVNVIISPKSAPELTAASNISYSGFTLNWEAVEEAVSYRLDVSTSNTFSSFLIGYENLTVTETHKDITALTEGTTYYYRVRTVDPADGVSTNSAAGSVQTLAYFAGGDGSVGNPYQVSSVDELNQVRNFLSSHFIQTEDIDLNVAPYNTDSGWAPVGNSSTPFTGTYNGQGHTITGLYIKVNMHYMGLFGYVSGSPAVISEIHLLNVNITNTGGNNVGSIVGLLASGATIENSSASGSVTSNFGERTGGLVGDNFGGIINSSNFSGSVSGYSFVGGIAGVNTNGQINYSYNQASVASSVFDAGGITGRNFNSSIRNSYNTGAVSGLYRIGGLIGSNFNSSVLTYSYSLGVVTGSDTGYGQVVGTYSSGTFINVLWNTETSGPGGAFGEGSTVGVSGVTSNQMRLSSTFTDWDFDTIWKMDEYGAFPVLQNNEQIPAPGYLAPASIAVNTGSLSFGVVPVNTDSIKTFTVNNTAGEGSRNLVISELLSTQSAYQVSPASAFIAPGGSQVFSVTFEPATSGAKPDSILISHNAADSPAKVLLSGTGVTGIILNPSPSTIAFGDLIKNQTAVQSVKIFNTGDEAATVSSISAANAVFDVTPSSGSIPAGDSLSVKVAFTPLAVQAYSDFLTIIYNAASSPIKIALSGSGLASHPGNAFQFVEAGGFNYLEIPDATHPTQYTIEAWVKPDSLKPMSIITRTSAAGPDADYSHALRINANGKFEHYTFAGTAGTATGTTTIVPGRWYHVAGVFTADKQVILYVNGVQEGNIPVTAGLPWAGGTRYLIGMNHANNTFKKLTGEVDELRLWHTARTAEQVQANMANTLLGSENGLIGYWKFDEASGPALNFVDETRTATVFGNPLRIVSDAPVQTPIISAETSELALFHNALSATSAAQNLGVQNTGSYPLTVTYNEVPSSSFTVTPEFHVIAAGQSAQFAVTFQSDEAGSIGETLTFVHTASVVPYTVAVTGTLVLAPATSASELAAMVTGPTSATLQWTSGNGSKRLVFVNSGSHTPPVNGTTYAVSGAVVFNGEGGTTDISGLAEYTPYTFKVYEYNGPAGYEQYRTTNIETGNFTTARHQAPSPGTAWVFSGSSTDYVNTNKALSQIAGSLNITKSISLWANPAGTGPEVGASYHGRALIGETAGYWGIYQATIGGLDRIWLYNWSQNEDRIGIPYTPGEWAHIAMVHHGGQVYAYKNGLLVGSVSSDATDNIGGTVRIGLGYTQSTFDGKIDEVAIWNTALTTNQIRHIMDQSPKGDEPNLMAYWNADEGVNTTVYDQTANNFHGVLSGNVSFTTDLPKTGAFINGTEDGWYFLSNPAPGVTLDEFLEPLWTQGATGSDSPENGQPNVFELNETTGAYQSITNLEVEAVPGKGYLVRVYKNDVYGQEGTFPKKLNTTRTAKPASASLPVSYTEESLFPGFSLVGNPHPNAIDLEHSGWQFNNMNPSVYLYDETLGDYRSYNRSLSIGNNGGTRYIAPLQGFLVEASAAGAELSLPDSAAVTHSVALLKQGETLPRIQLEVAAGERAEQTQLVFHLPENSEVPANQTLQLEPLSHEKLMLYSLDAGRRKIDVAEFPGATDGYLDIPIGIETTLSSEVTLKSVLNGINEEWEVFLVDKETGTFFDVRGTHEYTFITEAPKNKQVVSVSLRNLPKKMNTASGEITEPRFLLRAGYGVALSMEEEFGLPKEISLHQNYPNPFNPSTTINFELPAEAKVSLEVFDILGRKVATLISNETIKAGNHAVRFNAQELASGMYLYRFVAGNKVITKKLMLIK